MSQQAAALSPEELDRINRYFQDWLAEQFESTQEFTNKMSFAGYTGGFAIWILLKSQLTPSAMDWVGIMLLISLGTFVGWNVFNMIWMAIHRLRMNVQLQGVTGDQVRQRHIELENELRRKTEQLYVPAWSVVVIVCSTTACIAFGILLVTATINLLSLSV